MRTEQMDEYEAGFLERFRLLHPSEQDRVFAFMAGSRCESAADQAPNSGSKAKASQSPHADAAPGGRQRGEVMSNVTADATEQSDTDLLQRLFAVWARLSLKQQEDLAAWAEYQAEGNRESNFLSESMLTRVTPSFSRSRVCRPDRAASLPGAH